MQLRNPDTYRTTKVHTEQFRTSSIPTMQRFLNMESKCAMQEEKKEEEKIYNTDRNITLANYN